MRPTTRLLGLLGFLALTSLPVQAATPQLTAGEQHSLALHADGTVYAWGDNTHGQLGNGQSGEGLLSARPVRVQNLTDIIAIAALVNHNLALRADGTLWAWGRNDQGQLGDGSRTDRSTPVQVSRLTDVTAMATGLEHSLAVRADGTLWAWGTNNGGRLGNGIEDWSEGSTVPILVQTLSDVADVAAGYVHSFAIKRDGTLWAWSQNDQGQLGLGTFTHEMLPVQVTSLEAVSGIATHVGHTLAQTRDGRLWAWGPSNEFGQFGNGTMSASALPVAVQRLPSSQPTALAVGWGHSVVGLTDGQVWTWGNNWYGQLGIGKSDHLSLPVQVSTLAAADTVAAGLYHTLGLTTDGFVWSWGLGGRGQLGLGGDRLFSESEPQRVLDPGGTGFLNLRRTAADEVLLTLKVEGSGRVLDSSGAIDCPGVCEAVFAANSQTRLSAVPDAGWSFAGWGGGCTGADDCTLTLVEAVEVTANFTELSNRYRLDSPVNGSFESGIGVVHGWVCEAGRVGLQVDDRAPFTAAYGSERADSQAICGDTANGFAAAINWSDYGDGEHTLILLADDRPLTEARVIVTTLGATFLTGLSAGTTVADFPAAGLNTPLVWSEPHQNFVVSRGGAAAATQADWASSAAGAGHWESPLAGGVESGQALIRGWVCAASTVDAELDGVRLALPYGSERADTRGVCGDTDNGYARAVNWNDYADGAHQIRLFLDGAVVETRSFQVATPGGQGRVSGVQRLHRIADVPRPGDSLGLQWSEPHQNFRIVAYAAAGQTAESYHRKVRAYFQGGLGRLPAAAELDTWSAVLRDNRGSVWRPTGDGLQVHVSALAGWGTAVPSEVQARRRIDTVLGNLFGAASGIDGRIPDYYVAQLTGGHIRERGLVNAVLNDLAIMPRADGSYGKPNGWTGGPGDGLLTPAQISAYRAKVE